MKSRSLTLLAILAATAGFAAPDAADDDKLIAQSRDVVRTFGMALKGELRDALATGGPLAAIDICKDRAPRIASDLSRSSGAKLRRTSLRFRNPVNAPEPWEARVLREFEAASASGGDAPPLEYFFREDDGTVRYMAAIRTDGVCLACHGVAIAPQIGAKLDSEYPYDSARGYVAGDIRGAFSVTWPVPQTMPEG